MKFRQLWRSYKWNNFIKKYTKELQENKEQVATIKEYLKKGMVTLLYGARDELHNEALVLKDFITNAKGA